MNIISDERPIVRLYTAQDSSFAVGNFGVTIIKPYTENGEMALILWFEIYKGDEVVARVNGRYVESVHYQ